MDLFRFIWQIYRNAFKFQDELNQKSIKKTFGLKSKQLTHRMGSIHALRMSHGLELSQQ